MNPRLNSTHGLELPLQNCQRGSHRGLGAHITDLQISNRRQPPSVLSNPLKQRRQNLTRLFVWQRHDVIPHCPGRNIYIPELTRRNRRVVSLNSKTTRLQTTRQVRQRTRIYKLANDGSTSASITTNNVDITQAISTKARNVRVLDEVLSLEFLSVFLFPVPAYGQYLLRTSFNGNDIGKRDFIFVPLQIKVGMNLQNLIAVIISKGIPLLFRLFLLNVRENPCRLA